MISIIVPIYNMEAYLAQCLDSIKAQTYTRWECLLVDDGSTDLTGEICRRYAAADPRFVYIRKENGGVSSARNAALERVRGEYIGFVDPDDWIAPEMYRTLRDMMDGSGADIVQVGIVKEYTDHSEICPLVKAMTTIDGRTATVETAFDRLPNYIWNRLHRREVISCPFPQGRVFEDYMVYGRWFVNVTKMVISPQPLYHYRMRRGSVTNSNGAREMADWFVACTDRMDSLGDTVDPDDRAAFIYRRAVDAAKAIARYEPDETLRLDLVTAIGERLRGLPEPSLRLLGLRVWIRSRRLRRSPGDFCRKMRSQKMSIRAEQKRQRSLFP